MRMWNGGWEKNNIADEKSPSHKVYGFLGSRLTFGFWISEGVGAGVGAGFSPPPPLSSSVYCTTHSFLYHPPFTPLGTLWPW